MSTVNIYGILISLGNDFLKYDTKNEETILDFSEGLKINDEHDCQKDIENSLLVNSTSGMDEETPKDDDTINKHRKIFVQPESSFTVENESELLESPDDLLQGQRIIFPRRT